MTEADHKTVQLPAGSIRYREAGEGPVVVFVHGYLVDGRLWDGVAERLASECRCILPDWPMGSHRTPMSQDADLGAAGMARLVAEFLDALGLDAVTLVGNDSGGAVSQIAATRHPERLARLVLTNCDTHENFPPAPIGRLPQVLRLPGLMTAMTMPLRVPAIRRAAFAPFAKTKVPEELLASWSEPATRDSAVRRDARKFAMGMDNRLTLEAAEALPRLGLPLLLVWAPEDRFFKLAYARRLEEATPGARLVEVEDAKTFVPIDQPERVAQAITSFVREGAPAGGGTPARG